MRKWFITVVMAAMLAVTPVAAWADETTAVEQTEASPASVESLISSIDGEYPKEEDVKIAREAVETLTMAQKVNVKNYNLLRAAEQKIAERTGSRPDSGQKRGTKYSFRISEYVPKVTITVKYMTDTDGDGIMEAPVLSMTSPTGAAIKIPGDKDSIQSSWYDFTITRTQSGATINVLKAENGTWTVEADNEVFFTLSDYAEQPSYEEVDPSAAVPTTAPEKSTDTKKKSNSSIGPVIGLCACVGILVFLFIMMKKTPSSKNDKKTKKKEETDTDGEQSEEEYQAELQRLLADFTKSKEAKEQPAKAEPKNTPVVEEDSRLFESVLVSDVNETPEDDGITPLSDDHENGGRFK